MEQLSTKVDDLPFEEYKTIIKCTRGVPCVINELSETDDKIKSCIERYLRSFISSKLIDQHFSKHSFWQQVVDFADSFYSNETISTSFEQLYFLAKTLLSQIDNLHSPLDRLNTRV